VTADGPLVLGIETSCDETGVGLVRGTTLLADAVASSVLEHERYGGVVPEVASRAHLEAMVPTIERACVAWWLGIAKGRGIQIVLPTDCSLLTHPFRYGYEYQEELAWCEAWLERIAVQAAPWHAEDHEFLERHLLGDNAP